MSISVIQEPAISVSVIDLGSGLQTVVDMPSIMEVKVPEPNIFKVDISNNNIYPPIISLLQQQSVKANINPVLPINVKVSPFKIFHTSLGFSAVQCEAAETINGHSIVYVFDDKAYMADRALHAGANLGVAIQSAMEGELLSVITLGEIQETSWSWAQGSIYWSNEGLSQVVPASGPIVRIGVASSPTSMFVFMTPPIMRN